MPERHAYSQDRFWQVPDVRPVVEGHGERARFPLHEQEDDAQSADIGVVQIGAIGPAATTRREKPPGKVLVRYSSVSLATLGRGIAARWKEP